MGLFTKKKEISIAAPVTGNLIKLEKVNDPVFAKKMMGDGFAIEPDDGNIVSPVDGVVSMVFPTKHAISLKSKSGLEIMLHLGIDTVELSGMPFELMVHEGNKITTSQPLVTMDLEAIAKAKKDPVVMLIITNMTDVLQMSTFDEAHITSGQKVINVNL
ncbi:PTS sugar transporter subunit IIA [Companilactobacillus hulinensis]|uniref:PTS sugar transporter subunit IIA n=1 Tax=Companilactobacillus hulinensis TaxID=2486007 RepID=UPI000F78115A|nr:PTS glucose transporter subunit IIA [Companilactobacillus hulinensis]